MIRLAVDAMGGDHAPSVIVDGAVAAARHLDARIALVGPTADLEQALAQYPDYRSLGIDLVEAPEVIGMADAPAAALRRKPRASIRVAAELVAGQGAAALFSAGHTGATVMAAHAAFGMIPGVDRPALATTIPTRTTPAVLLDAGANVECRPQHLAQFAVMGSVYARLAFGSERPRVGLLSVGEEETKGNELTKEAHRLLKASPLNFIGNVEGREIYSGHADVIVCDGFTGNVVLKTSEGLVDAVEALLGDELQGTFSSQVGYLLSRRAYRRFRRRVDYSEYGGAPLLGVAGLAIVGHGRSSVKAVRNALLMAYRFANGNFNDELRRTMDEFQQSASTRPPNS
ncbi:MAG: phosphate acyltransferase PlsX [Vicinamibacterales bacterium]